MSHAILAEISPLEFTDMTRRALAAYWQVGAGGAEPSQAMSGECTYQNRGYVVLANSYRVLAVYRVRSNGFLRRLKRWPKALETDV
jgi:hypothetical protein